MDSIDTAYNPRGLCCISLKEDLICCPDQEIGHIKIKFYDRDIQLADNKNSRAISKKAHSTTLFYMELNGSGDKLATASEKVKPYIIIFSLIDKIFCDLLTLGDTF